MVVLQKLCFGHFLAAALFTCAVALAEGFTGRDFVAPSPGEGWEVDPAPSGAYFRARLEKGDAIITLAFEPGSEPTDPEEFVREPFAIRARELGRREIAATSFKTVKDRPGFLLESVDENQKKHYAQAAVRLRTGMASASLEVPDRKTYEAERPGFLKMARGLRGTRAR